MRAFSGSQTVIQATWLFHRRIKAGPQPSPPGPICFNPSQLLWAHKCYPHEDGTPALGLGPLISKFLSVACVGVILPAGPGRLALMDVPVLSAQTFTVVVHIGGESMPIGPTRHQLWVHDVYDHHGSWVLAWITHLVLKGVIKHGRPPSPPSPPRAADANLSVA
jgi:hypothetical protein